MPICAARSEPPGVDSSACSCAADVRDIDQLAEMLRSILVEEAEK